MIKTKFYFPLLSFFIFGIIPFSTAQTYSYLDSVGMDFYKKDKADQALPFFIKALDLLKKESSQNDSLLALTTSHLGMAYMDIEDYEFSEKYYLQSLDYVRKNSETHLKILGYLGFLYSEQKRWGDGEKYYNTSLEIITKHYDKTHPLYTKTLGNLSFIYMSNLAFDRAESVLLEAMKIVEENTGKENPNYTSFCFKLSQTYFKKQDFGKAEKLHQEALSILKKILGENNPEYLNQYKNLGGIYAMQGKLKEAEFIFLESARIVKKQQGTDNKTYLNIIANLGGFYQKTRQFDKAKKPLYEALALYQKIYGNKHFETEHALINLGNFYSKQGQLDSASHYAQQSLFVNLKKQPSNTDLFSEEFVAQVADFDFHDKYKGLTTLDLIADLSMGYYNQTKDDKFLKINFLQNKAHIQLIEKFRTEFVSDQDKINYSQDLVEASLQGLQALFQLKDQSPYSEEMLHLCEQNKSVLLEEAIQTQAAHRFGDLPDSLVLVEKELQQKLSSIKTKMMANDSSSALMQSEYNIALVEVGNFQGKISKKYPHYYDLKYRQKTAQLKEIQANLTDGMAILEYSFFNEISFILTITKSSISLDTLSIKKAALVETIDQFLPYLRDFSLIVKNPEKAKEEYARHAYQLYQSCLAAPLSKLKGINKLIIVADNHLGYIPFEILLTKDIVGQKMDYHTMPYLLNDFAISYSYSVSLWQSNIETANTYKNQSNKVLGIAARYDKKESLENPNRTLRHQKLRASLSELPSAIEEIKTLEQKFAGSFVTDSTGTEAFFKSQAKDFGIIHLAMHGLMDEKRPILSSLVLSDNKDDLEDNFLEAWEISHLKLQAQLVVLSACETGYGKFEQGEGVMSLARSFMYAGVPSLVVSLWQVNDASTAMMMQVFYQYLADGMDKAEALKQAKIQYLSKAEGVAAHPAFWSPFILFGDSRAIAISTKNNWWFWGIGGIGLLVLGAGIIGFRKR